jgi:hypothetical protein
LVTGVVRVRSGVVQGNNLVAPDQHVLVETEPRADCPACGDIS